MEAKMTALLEESQTTVAAVVTAEEERSQLKAQADMLEREVLCDLLRIAMPVLRHAEQEIQIRLSRSWDCETEGWDDLPESVTGVPLRKIDHTTVSQVEACLAGWLGHDDWPRDFPRYIIVGEQLRRGKKFEGEVVGPYADCVAKTWRIDYEPFLIDGELVAKHLGRDFGPLCHAIWHVLAELLVNKQEAVRYHMKRIERAKALLARV